MSNKGIDWLRLKASCLILPKYMVLRLAVPTFKNIVQIEVSLTYGWSPSALVCLRPCCLIMPKNVVLCLYVPKRRDVVQTKLFMSNKGTGWLRLKALCLVVPKYMVLCLNMPTRKNIVQIEVSLIQTILIIGSVPGCARRAIGIVSGHA